MSLIPLSRLLVISAFLCACLVPQTGAFADDWDDCENKYNSQPDLAISACTAIINSGNQKKEDMADAYYYRGSAYNKREDYNSAISDFSQAIALIPGDADAYNRRGIAYRKKGDLDGAIADYNQAIKLDPSHPAASKNRDKALSMKGAAAAPAPAPTYPTAPTGCPPAWVLPNGGCVGTVTPAPTPAPPVRRAAPTPTYPTAPPVRRAAPAPPPVNLAFPLQSELKRLGCLTGQVDGVWGGGSRAALRRFSNEAGLRLGSEPSQNALDEAKNTDSGYCRPVRVAPKRTKPKGCRSGTVFLEGQCIPRSEVASFCGPGFERSGSKCVRMKADHELPSSVKKKKRCSAIKFAFTRGNTCACSGGRIFTGSACVKPQQSGGGSGQTCTPGQTRKANNCRFQCECTGLVTCNWVVEVCE